MAQNYMSKRKSFVFKEKFYTRVDSSGRLSIPKIFILPENWKTHKGYYMGENKIYFEPDDKNLFKGGTMKFNIPSQICQLLNVKCELTGKMQKTVKAELRRKKTDNQRKTAVYRRILSVKN